MSMKAELSTALQEIRKKTARNPAYKPTQDEFATMIESAQVIDKESPVPISISMESLVRQVGKSYGLTC